MTKTLEDTMPYGKYKGWQVGRLCRLEPGYVHFLVNSGQMTATAAICNEIQKGYDAEAKCQTQAQGAMQAGRYLFVWNPIIPKQAPSPTT